MAAPMQPKLYHICHMDRLPSILADGCLWSDAEMARRTPAGSTIGMSSIKQRRLSELTLSSYPDLHVGDCVPFYLGVYVVKCGVVLLRGSMRLGAIARNRLVSPCLWSSASVFIRGPFISRWSMLWLPAAINQQSKFAPDGITE